MTARSILLVDDDDDLRETLVEQLSLYEEFAISGSLGHQGCAGSQEQHVDLLIMDVGLPDMDGREAVKAAAQGRLQGADHHAHRP
jgi:CheY-like chemotaxis protein